jgi:hypothetical protein
MEAYRAIAYRRDSFSAKLRRHGIPDTAVYGKGVRFVLRGPARTGACVCPPSRPHARHVRHRARARHTTAKCRRNNSCAAASTVS